MPRKPLLKDDDEVLRRCRRARERLLCRFGSLDAYCAHLEQQQRESPPARLVRRSTSRRKTTNPRTEVRSQRPAVSRAR